MDNQQSVLTEIGFYDYFKCDRHEDDRLNVLRNKALFSIYKNIKRN